MWFTRIEHFYFTIFEPIGTSLVFLLNFYENNLIGSKVLHIMIICKSKNVDICCRNWASDLLKLSKYMYYDKWTWFYINVNAYVFTFYFLGKIDEKYIHTNLWRILGVSPTLLTLHTNEDLPTKKSIQASWILNDSEVVELVV